MALLLSEEHVERLLTMREALDAVREAFRAFAAGRAVNAPRARVRLPGAVLNVMAAGLGSGMPGAPGGGHGPAPATVAGPGDGGGHLDGGGYLGVKSYSIGRDRARFLFLLYAARGELLAIIEADRLGQIRTGAASGIATEFMARANARTAGIIGTGWQARSQLEAVAAVRPIRVARAFGRRDEARRAFAREMEAKLGIEVIPVASAEEAVRDADIVITITTSREPVMDGRWIAPGVHLNAAGSNFAHRRELDDEAVARATFIAVDSVEQARIEAGDLVIAAEHGRLDWNRVHELADVVSGKRGARAAPEDITLFKSNGIALEDVAVAARVYERAVVERVGREVVLGSS